jgi:hydrogenase maturation protein HypF
MTASTAARQARVRITVTGVVQGVGFRPFVHRLATGLGLSGFVGNDAHGVFIEAQGSPAAIAELQQRLATDAPPLAHVTAIRQEAREPLEPRGPAASVTGEAGFRIVASTADPGTRTLVPPDIATCDACLRELFDPADRRYRHPFITCTNCGPRFSIITDLPYDRPATTMAGFAMCDRCAAEYHHPANRRFHAQPIACPGCGPALRFELLAPGELAPARPGTADEAIAAAQRLIADGGIVAVKGIGGYHLACRADDPGAIARLRARKARDDKPFALLARDLVTAGRLVVIDAAEQRVLTSPARPVVLLRRLSQHRLPGSPVADNVAPGNPLLGMMLAYSPVHHLLLRAVPGMTAQAPAVLVFTSANITDEPLCFDDADARERLRSLADAMLTHDRPIHVPCDDSVVRVIDSHELPIRRSRGYAPLPVPLGRAGRTVLAVGAELKNSCCLTDGGNAYCSAHIGDMGNLATLRAFDRAVAQLTTLRRAAPEVIAADLHPAYQTRAWAQRHAGQPGEPELRLIQHHHAHVASLLAEHGRLGQPVLGVAFDGTGYGWDGTVWGGEFLLVQARLDQAERVGRLRPVALPGGDAGVRNPCRLALAYLTAASVTWDLGLHPVRACSPAERAVLSAQLAGASGTVASTSMGRLFDAVSALIGVRQRVSYEAQAAIELEILAGQASRAAELPLPVGEDAEIDFRPLIAALAAAVLSGRPAAELALGFHLAVADAVAIVAGQVGRSRGIEAVGLTGGVFQNVLLTRACQDRLAARGMEVLTHRLVPPNDGGLALGQAAIAAFDPGSAVLPPPAEGGRPPGAPRPETLYSPSPEGQVRRECV